jgi:tetratricopeptide (TPR) repeat protein
MRWNGIAACFLFATTVFAQQLPPGTHSADDHSREIAAAQQMRDAESALEKQDYAGAETTLKALIAANPVSAKDGRIEYDLGFAEERTGEEVDAAKAYAAAIAALPGFAEPEIALGLLDARAGRFDAAHEELLDASKLPAAAPELRGRALRALAHLDETTNPEAAREELLAALKLTPETADDVLMSAELAERADDAADAETAYRRALTMTPNDAEATAGLAHVLQQQKKTTEAETLLTGALQQHPNDPRLVAQAASLYATEGKPGAAIPLLEQLRASDAAVATDPSSTLLLAHLYAADGKNAEAEKLYKSLLVTQTKNPSLLDDLGSAQVMQQHYADAEATLTRAVGMRVLFHDDQAWAEMATHLAFAASKNGDPKTCLEALASRATVLPDSPSSLFLEATAHDTLHQYKDAERAYRAFLALANGKFPDQEFQARHRLVALQNMK